MRRTLVKAIFSPLEGEYPKKHEFEEKKFEDILRNVPKKLEFSITAQHSPQQLCQSRELQLI